VREQNLEGSICFTSLSFSRTSLENCGSFVVWLHVGPKLPNPISFDEREEPAWLEKVQWKRRRSINFDIGPDSVKVMAVL
jgi:hypothetical protein